MQTLKHLNDFNEKIVGIHGHPQHRITMQLAANNSLMNPPQDPFVAKGYSNYVDSILDNRMSNAFKSVASLEVREGIMNKSIFMI